MCLNNIGIHEVLCVENQKHHIEVKHVKKFPVVSCVLWIESSPSQLRIPQPGFIDVEAKAPNWFVTSRSLKTESVDKNQKAQFRLKSIAMELSTSSSVVKRTD